MSVPFIFIFSTALIVEIYAFLKCPSLINNAAIETQYLYSYILLCVPFD